MVVCKQYYVLFAGYAFFAFALAITKVLDRGLHAKRHVVQRKEVVGQVAHEALLDVAPSLDAGTIGLGAGRRADAVDVRAFLGQAPLVFGFRELGRSALTSSEIHSIS